MKPSDDPSGKSPPGARYRLYGVDFATDFPFTLPLPPAQGAPRLSVVVRPADAPSADEMQTPLYTSPLLGESSTPLASVYTANGSTRLQFTATGDFHLSPDRILYSPLPDADPVLAQSQLLGPVFAVWLEERGHPVLHASTVGVDGAAAAFLSASHGGKSSLAAALMHAGAALMSDDLLVVEEREGVWMAEPAYAQLRMWPELAQQFLPGAPELDRVHPSTPKLRVPVGAGVWNFQRNSLPLQVIYLPQRREAGADHSVRIDPAPATAGLMELVRQSFLARMLQETGRQALRLPMLAQLARAVPIRVLSYPNGFEHLPGVAAAIIEDVKSLQAGP
ncbi:MAG: hypothetical protein ACO1SX_27030 [Actinomycetota bacterium]